MDERPLIASAWLKPDYRASLEQAGARIRELTPGDALPGALDGCSGLMLTGGVDVDPREYGERRRAPDRRNRPRARRSTNSRSRAKPWRATCRCSPSAAARRC